MIRLIRAFSVTPILQRVQSGRERCLKPEDPSSTDVPEFLISIFAVTSTPCMPCPDVRKVNSVLPDNLRDKEKSEKA